jgi:hypothetical protein
MAFKASLMFPAVPGRRFGLAVPGPRRVAIISGPTTGGRRCPRYGTLLNRGFGVRSSWSRSGSFSGLPSQARCRTRAAVQKPFRRRGEVFFYVAAVANVATPGESLLQQASAGQPKQQDQRRIPGYAGALAVVPLLTTPSEWRGGRCGVMRQRPTNTTKGSWLLAASWGLRTACT